MFKEKYILDNEYIKPDQQLLESLKLKMLECSQTQDFNDRIQIKRDFKSSFQKVLLPLGSIASCVLFIFFMSKVLELGNHKLGNSVDSTATIDSVQDTYVAQEDSFIPEEARKKQDNLTNDVSMATLESTMLNESPLYFDSQLIDTISVTKLEDNNTSILLDSPDKKAMLIEYLNTMVLTPITENKESGTSGLSITLTFTNGQEDTILLIDTSLNYNNQWYSFHEADLEQINNLIEN